MEPLEAPVAPAETPETSAPETPTPGLQEAADTLAGLVEGKTPAAPAEAPETAPGAQPGPRGAAPPAAPTREQQSRRVPAWKRRIMERAERPFLARQAEYDRRIAEQNELMKAMVEHLRGQQKPMEEEIPDAALDPAGFAKWLKAQNESAVRPILEHLERMQTLEGQRQQEQVLHQQRQEQAREIQTSLEDFEAAYLDAAPEVAAGCRERATSMRQALVEGFTESGLEPAAAAERAGYLYLLIAREAEERGENPVAAIDAFVVGIARAFGLEPGGGPPAAGTGNGGGHYQPPQPSEAARLAEVQRRSAAASNAGPRVPARETAPGSELKELIGAGVTDINALRAAALRDSHGDMQAASYAMSRALQPGA